MSATDGFAAGVDAGQVELSYAQETTYGELPSVAFQAVRLTSESLKGQKTRTAPNEIRKDRMVSANITTQESASGAINLALSYGTYDDWLSGLLGGEWSADLAIAGVSGDITAAATGNKFTSTTSGKFTNVVVGQWIKTAGFSTAGNNGFFRVTAKADAQTLTVAGGTLTDETPSGSEVTIKGSGLINGTVFKSFYVQKRFSSALFLRYPGTYMASATLTAATGNFLSGSFNVLSQDEVNETTDASTGAVVAAPTGLVIDPVAGFGGVQVDNEAVQTKLQNVTLNLTNNGAAQQFALGSAGSAGILPGMFMVAGQMTAYFKDFTLYQRFKDETAGPLSFRTQDAGGNAYVFTVPNSRIMNPSIVAGGVNQSVVAQLQLEGNPDPTLGYAMRIDRFAAA